MSHKQKDDSESFTIRPGLLNSPTQAYRRIVKSMIEISRSMTKLRLGVLALPVAIGVLAVALSAPARAAMDDGQPAASADRQPAPIAATAPPAPANSRPASPQPIPAQVAMAKSEPTTLPEVRKYCTNIAAAATEARFAWQTTKLNELEARLKGKIRELDAKEAELREWIDKRDAIQKEASEKLVGIYSKMRPETAASQISALDDDMAAAVLGQLGPRQASAIFNEIVPDRAAKLAGLIAGATPSDKKL